MASNASRDYTDKAMSAHDLLFLTAGGTPAPVASSSEQALGSRVPSDRASPSSGPAAPPYVLGRSASIKITHISKRGKQRAVDAVRNRSVLAASTDSAKAEAVDARESSRDPMLTEEIKKRQAIFEKQILSASDRSCQLTANSILGKNRELREALKLPSRTISQRASEILNATLLSAENRQFLNRMSCDLNLENERFSHRSQLIQAAQLRISDISTADLLHDPASKLGQISRRAQAGVFTPLEMPERRQHSQAQVRSTEQSPFSDMPIVNRVAPSSSSSSSSSSSPPPSGKNPPLSRKNPPPSPGLPLAVAHFKEPSKADSHFSSNMALLTATQPLVARSPLVQSPPKVATEDTSTGFIIGSRGDKKISWSFMSSTRKNSIFNLHKFGGLLGGAGADRDACAQAGAEEGAEGAAVREAAL